MAEAQSVSAPDEQAAALRREIKIVLPGLLLAILLAMLDQLIVGTALPRIVGDLGGVAHLSWVVTAYVLVSAVTTPLYGKLGDLYGRKKLFMAAIVIFLTGSALSGLAQSMTQLIGFRALQGLGAGGLMVGAMAILGELVSPRERGKYMGYIMAVMMVATIGGPLAGGFITDHLSWRWVFYINLPIGGVTLVYLARVLRLPASRMAHKIDYMGAGLLGLAATAIVLVSTWGGTEYPWGSGRIISIAVLALAITFLPLYQQTVQGASATASGLLLTPMMVGVMVTSIVAGQITSLTGRYKMLPIVGSVGMGGGMYLLSLLGAATTRVNSGLFFVVLGLGMGLLMQTTSLMAQNSVELKDIGVASSSRLFFQQIGGSIGVSVFGAIFARRLTDSLSARLPGAHIHASGGQLNPATVAALPPAVRQGVFFAIAHAIDGVFIWAVPAMAAAFVVALFIKEIPLRGKAETPGEAAAASPELVH